MTAAHQVLHGIGVSPGTATGPAVVVAPPALAPADEPAATDPATAQEQVSAALEAVASGLEQRAARSQPAAQAVLGATAMMARDPGLATEVKAQLDKGLGPTRALAAAVETYCAMFESMGGYMAERVADLRDVRDRATARLLGLPEPGVPDLAEPCVLVAHDLAPAETATLPPELVLGIVTEAGGPTSHTAILAAQLGIPAVVRALGVLHVEAGTVLALDGGSGEVLIAPTEEDGARLAERAARRNAALAHATGPGRTRDGHGIPLLANIGTPDDARRAAATEAEGVGLFRTEFLFLDRDAAPTLEEQTATYREVFEAFGERRVVVRTLDAGADKPLAFADLGPEENPALGRRGLRLSQARTDLLDTQLSALAAAAQATGADVRVMAPMVATVDEAQWFAERVRGAGLPKVGVMVEVPAAALRAAQVLAQLDFASIGTNDLGQYAMAADRMQGELARLLDPWQPALLDLVAAACDGGRSAGAPVGVCGEAAGDPLLALVLVGLGVASLSMSTGRLAAVRASLAAHDLGRCQEMAAAARAEATASATRDAVLALADPVVTDLL
jgi:phosphotransferase system enzyme I (PtsI)